MKQLPAEILQIRKIADRLEKRHKRSQEVIAKDDENQRQWLIAGYRAGLITSDEIAGLLGVEILIALQAENL